MKGTNVYMGLSICFDDIPKGRRNLITDVPGVLVGHATLSRGDVQTGVKMCIRDRKKSAMVPGPE